LGCGKLGAADNHDADRKSRQRSGHWRRFLCERFLGRSVEHIMTLFIAFALK